jgi:HPt (histidine-containing phosphotransfer) domain-containing protein
MKETPEEEVPYDRVSDIQFEQDSSIIPEINGIKIEIPGIDTALGLSLYDGKLDIYKLILRSFLANAPALISSLSDVTEDNLKDYIIAAHGAKGSCAIIGARQLTKNATELEKKAKEGDLSGILIQNDDMINDLKQLTASIEEWLSKT